jgi:hypothetical protein
MENTDYRKQCVTRAGAEARVGEMVCFYGVRKSGIELKKGHDCRYYLLLLPAT